MSSRKYQHDIGHGGTSLLAAIIRRAVLDARQGNYEATAWLDHFFPEWSKYESKEPAKRHIENYFDFSPAKKARRQRGLQN